MATSVFLMLIFFSSNVKGVSSSSKNQPSASSVVPGTTKPPMRRMTFPRPPSISPNTTTPSPSVAKRTYYMNITLARYPWKPKYDIDGITDIFTDIAVNLPPKIKSLFISAKSTDLKEVTFQNTTSPSTLASNNGNKVMALMKITFAAAPDDAKEPEAFLTSQNDHGALGNFNFDEISVKETVEDGAVLGDWTKEGCVLCCGQQIYQNRTCAPSKDCDGVILNRTIACQWTCPLKCGTVRTFTFTLTLTDNKWKTNYANPKSDEYKNLYDTLAKGNDSLMYEVKKLFSNLASKTAYKYTKNNIHLKQVGEYVGVSFAVVFDKPPSNADDPEAIFRYEVEKGKLGKFSIDVKTIKVTEETLGYTFTDWTTGQDSCSKCCGGEINQTRTCTSRVGKCTDAQLERKIKCKHVCSEVECSGSKAYTSSLLTVSLSFLVSMFWY